jgi:GT2 family glycosyltransferase
VVIVTWNARELLRHCLTSLRDDGVPSWAEILVVDNASTDGSAAVVEAEFPFVELIASAENLGFSRGNNLAIRKTAGEFILLLNPDTVVHAGTIRKLVEFARSHPDVGAVGPKQLGADGAIQLDSAVDYPTVWNVFCDHAHLSKLFPKSRLFCGRKMGYWDHEGDREVPVLPGSAMLVRRAVFERIGLLDETLFYVEDVDLCRRMQAAGWSVYYLGSTSIVHYGGGSTQSSPHQILQRQISFQSFWLYTRKHRGRAVAAALTFMVFAWSAAVAGVALPCSWLARGERRIALRRHLDLARGLLRWSLLDKSTFRHHLAAPPGSDAARTAPAWVRE